MSLLIRKIRTLSHWQSDGWSSRALLPASCVVDFGDHRPGGLSFFEAETGEVPAVLAALSTDVDLARAEPKHFPKLVYPIGLTPEAFIRAEAVIVATPGRLGHPNVDERHREVADLTAAGLFRLAWEAYVEIRSSRAQLLVLSNFELAAAARVSLSNPE